MSNFEIKNAAKEYVMPNIIIGIDPDADQYGVAFFKEGRLIELTCKNVVSFVAFISSLRYENYKVVFVIEDVKSNKFMYNRDLKSPATIGKVAQNVGECKHSQKVAEQFIEHYGFKLIRQPPTKGNWAKNKKQFEQVTGWTGRSNEDTRSAAFIAFLHLERIKQEGIKNEKIRQI